LLHMAEVHTRRARLHRCAGRVRRENSQLQSEIVALSESAVAQRLSHVIRLVGREFLGLLLEGKVSERGTAQREQHGECVKAFHLQTLNLRKCTVTRKLYEERVTHSE